jgi:hypothetical protein
MAKKLPAEIRNGDLPNASPEPYRYPNLLGKIA